MNTLKPALAMILAATTLAASPTESRPAAADAISRLGWISGHWCQDDGRQRIEERWLDPRGGLLLGAGRTVVDGKATAFEFLRIEVRDGAVTLLAQPNGAPPVPFRLTASGADWGRFENPAHDFPKRVEYRRTATGLHAQIAGPGRDGREQVIPFDYLPCRDG
jgi:hypothetical protein